MEQYLIKDTTLTEIADQIRTMHGSANQIKCSNFPSALNQANALIVNQESLIDQILEVVEALPEKEGGIDTSDATATADTILSGYSAYVNGEKIEGSIEEKTSLTGALPNATLSQGVYSSAKTVAMRGRISDACYVNNPTVILSSVASNFGNATAEDVTKGKTFTSAQGLKVVGTSTKIDTSDATATENDLISGTTAYANGELITGNINIAYGGISTEATLVNKSYMGQIGMEYQIDEPICIKPNYGSLISLGVSTSEFGDASPEDVAEGKTFTSAAGLKITGTATPTSSSNIFQGTVESNQEGVVIIPYPGFVPHKILLWNIKEIDQWEETGDDSLIRYLYDGVMLSAIRFGNNRWISQQMLSNSGTTVICQSSAERGPFRDDNQDYGNTNITDDGEIITWSLGQDPYSTDDTYTDISGELFSYVLIG